MGACAGGPWQPSAGGGVYICTNMADAHLLPLR